MRWRRWLRHYATNRNNLGSIPNTIGIFFKMYFGSVWVCHLSFSVCSNLPLFTSSIYVTCVLTSFFQCRLGKANYALLVIMSSVSLAYMNDSTALCWTLVTFFSFLILYTIDRTPWTGDQLTAKPLLHPRQINVQRHPFLAWIRNHSLIVQWAKTIPALGLATTAISTLMDSKLNIAFQQVT
jgi:hypothetical protein